jgi:hypothetical protein
VSSVAKRLNDFPRKTTRFASRAARSLADSSGSSEVVWLSVPFQNRIGVASLILRDDDLVVEEIA